MVHSPSPTDFLPHGSVRRSNKTARLPQSAVPVIHFLLRREVSKNETLRAISKGALKEFTFFSSSQS